MEVRKDDTYQIFRNVCPRNCFGTCGLISYVKEGKLIKVEGDLKHGYTKGRLCAKGYAFPEYVYHPERLRYPMRQFPRGSGNWQRISWEEALSEISSKILELHKRYDSNLALGYNWFSGNMGYLHNAVIGMFEGMGPHTKPVGNPCLAAGGDALAYDYGAVKCPDPETMADAQLILIWGVNPAWTSVHQLHFIQQARDQGAKVVVIDPLFTPTASKADLYLQLRPGTDGLLALVLLKLLMDRGKLDNNFIKNSVKDWEQFQNYLKQEIKLENVSDLTGIEEEGILDLAKLLEERFPAAYWIGFGMQRHTNGGQTVRVINALAALTGNLGVRGGGLFYYHCMTSYFPSYLNPTLLGFSEVSGGTESRNRLININNFASEALRLKHPPLKFLWVSCRNSLSQDLELSLWDRLIEQLEMVVTVDLYLSTTAKKSDIVLPATSIFEAVDLNVSYWHRWVGLNEKAIEPFYEAKSDLEIARELTEILNARSPGFSKFPSKLSPEEWIRREFTPEILEELKIADWEDLRQGPRKLPRDVIPWRNGKFDTEDGFFHLLNVQGKTDSFLALPKHKHPQTAGQFPLRLLTPQNLIRLHSQYAYLKSLNIGSSEERIEINPETALLRGIDEGDCITVFNQTGAYYSWAHLNPYLPKDVVVTFQGGLKPINQVITKLSTDMGARNYNHSGIAFYDTFVQVEKNRGNING